MVIIAYNLANFAASDVKAEKLLLPVTTAQV